MLTYNKCVCYCKYSTHSLHRRRCSHTHVSQNICG